MRCPHGGANLATPSSSVEGDIDDRHLSAANRVPDCGVVGRARLLGAAAALHRGDTRDSQDGPLMASPEADTNNAVPPGPMRQDKGRWRVAPAPDGRGMPDGPKPRPPHRWRGFWIVVAVVLAIN